MRRALPMFAMVLLSSSACSDGAARRGDAGTDSGEDSGPSCTSDGDCDDGFDCTIDTCAVGGECRNMPLDERCEDPTPVCDPSSGEDGSGCTADTGCSSDTDCDDGFDCTVDTCTVDEACANDPLDERCADGESCSATMGCFTPMDCTSDDECQDDDFCNGREFCMPEFGCMPAPEPRMCDDSDECTEDTCDSESNMCVFTCDASRDGCDCPASCNGLFRVTPGRTFSCYFGMVSYDISELTFTVEDGVLTVSPRSSTFPNLTDLAAPVCPEFDAEVTVSGGCNETYRVYGMFTDDDNFDATWEVTFTGSCMPSLTSCTDQSESITGTRM